MRVASLSSFKQSWTRTIFIARSGLREECKMLSFWLIVLGGRGRVCNIYGQELDSQLGLVWAIPVRNAMRRCQV